MKIIRILSWGWVGVLTYLMIESLFFTPLIEWGWGFYNNKLISTAFLILVTMTLSNCFNILKIKEEMKE